MKLVFINTIPLWGGGEKWTLDAAVELKRRGHGISILSSEKGELLKETRSVGLEAVPVPSTWWGRRGFAGRIHDEFRENRPDLLIANCGRDIRLANRIRGSSINVPLVFRRGLDRPLSSHPVHRYSLNKVQAILANSNATKDSIRSSFPWFPEERIYVIYNPIRTEDFLSCSGRDVRGKLGIGKEVTVIGIVGRLSKQKGHGVFFKAFSRIVENLPDAVALVVGGGELREELVELAGGLGISGSVRFTGHVRDVQPYYDACDIVAVPSIYEGFCFTALEAQLMGKPVVASDTSSLPEIVEDGRTGFLVPPNDPGALAEKLSVLASDPKLRERMGEAGRVVAFERFDSKRIYDELEELLEGVIERF